MKLWSRIIAFLLAAHAFSVAFGQSRVVYVTDDLKKAAALKASIDDFKQSTTQLTFGNDRGKADASYVEFELRDYKLNSLTDVGLTSTFSAFGRKAARYRSRCGGCEIIALFDDTVDQTLFGTPSVYPALVIDDCRSPGLQAIDVVVKPVAGIGLEQRILYGVRLANVPDEMPLLLRTDSSSPWDGTKASLTLVNSAFTQWNYLRKTCGTANDAARKSGARTFVLVPHKVTPGRAGSGNANAITVTR